VEDIGINVMAYGQRSQRYATSQILRHQFCFELRTVTPAPANLLGIVLCHYKHPLIISWVLSLAYFDGAEKMPSPDAYNQPTWVNTFSTITAVTALIAAFTPAANENEFTENFQEVLEAKAAKKI